MLNSSSAGYSKLTKIDLMYMYIQLNVFCKACCLGPFGCHFVLENPRPNRKSPKSTQQITVEIVLFYNFHTQSSGNKLP